VHARFILSEKRHRIVAVCDEDRPRAEAFAQRFGAGEAYATLAELLERARPDVVHVLTPPQSHAPLTLEAMRAGCHVLVEKPMALSVLDADAMIDAARDCGVKLCVNHNQLFEPVVLQARRLVADGSVGTVVSVESYYGFNLAQAGERRWVAELPGSVFQNLAPHPISVMLPFIGDPSELHVSSVSTGALGSDLPDELRVLLTGRRATGVLSVSLAAKPHLNFLRIYGSKAILHVDIANMILSIERLRRLPKAAARGLMSVEQGAQLAFGAARNAFKLLSGRLKTYQGLGNLIRAFHDSIERDEDPPVSGMEARRVMQVFESIQSRLRPTSEPRRTHRSRPARAPVFVTGASGFLGGHLVTKLAQQGVAVRALARPSSRIAHLRSLDIDWVDGSLADGEKLKTLLNGCEVVYHCAAATKGPWSDYLESTIRGTERLLAASLATGVRRFVHVSSLSVYGVGELADGALVTEDTPYEPYPALRGFYSHSKIEAEKRVVAYSREHGLQTVILRPGTIYGPRGKVFFPRIGYSIKHRVFVVIGRGSSLVPLTYVGNVADAIVLAGTQEQAAGHIYNIVDDGEITQRQYLDHFVRMTANRAFSVYLPFGLVYAAAGLRDMAASPAGRGDLSSSNRYRLVSATRNLRYDNAHAKTHLQWRPNVSLDEGLRRTFDWYNNGQTPSWSLEPAPVAVATDPS
jgi:nucleoside-diphosphate-sugar epimerase/predicted dehydrogenase